MAASRPPGPACGSHVASSVVTTRERPRLKARNSPGRSATNGDERWTVAGRRGSAPRSGLRRPSSTERSITMRSRSGSMAGLVTCANDWRRWSTTGRSSRASAGVGVSSPMLQSGSWPSRAMVLMSRRIRSASSPASQRVRGAVRAVETASKSSWKTCRRSAGGDAASPLRRPRLGAMCRTATFLASASVRIACSRGSTTNIWPGPSRSRSAVSAAAIGTAPASDAAATRRSVVTVMAAGRKPLRSSITPTR